MAAFTTALAVGAVATSAAGLYTQYTGNKKAQSAAEAQYAADSQLSAQSAEFSRREQGINIESANAQAAASVKSQGINKEILGYERGIEGQRFNAMELDARRKQMEILRQHQRARSMALTTSTSQGSSRGSGLQGAYGQASGMTGFNLAGVQGNLDIGRNIFGLNNQITGKRIESSDLISSLAYQQADLQTRKSNLISEYAGVNASLQTQRSRASTDLASAQGQIAIGGALLQAGPQIYNAGTNFLNASSINTNAGGPTSLAPPNPGPSMGNYLPMTYGIGPRGLY